MKICLIGSTRFRHGYVDLTRRLSLAGHLVYSIAGVFVDEKLIDSEEHKEILDLVHLAKILASDAVVLVTNKEEYIGKSTRREIIWAEMHGKTVYKPPGVIVAAFGDYWRRAVEVGTYEVGVPL